MCKIGEGEVEGGADPQSEARLLRCSSFASHAPRIRSQSIEEVKAGVESQRGEGGEDVEEDALYFAWKDGVMIHWIGRLLGVHL